VLDLFQEGSILMLPDFAKLFGNIDHLRNH
jgi:hypothetical protein